MESHTDSTSSESELESLIKFKLKTGLQCIICKKTGNCSQASIKTLKTFINATEIRETMTNETDLNIRNAIADGNNGNFQNVVWHKSCYLTYISKKSINYLKNKVQQKKEYKEMGIVPPTPEGRSLRKETFDVNKCVFCQKRAPKKRLSQVMSTNIENKIKHIASVNVHLVKRIGSDDLIAKEIKYHTSCLISEQKKQLKQKRLLTINVSDSKFKNDAALRVLINEIHIGLEKGKCFTITSAYTRYLKLGGSKSKRLVVDSLKSEFGTSIDIVKQKKVTDPSIITPSTSKHEVIQNYVETKSAPSHLHNLYGGQSELSVLHKICTDIGTELDNIPDFENFSNLSIQSYKNVVPKTLIWLIELLWNKKNEDVAVNICQDIIYNRSNGKKMTPKHIGLGIMVHQETRSKKLIDELHTCGHSISYKDVLRMRKSIAQNEITRFIENDNCFIPRQFSCKQFCQFAADNIDILEETLEKSPTFHGTQIVAFQKGPISNIEISNVKLLPNNVKLNIPENFNALRRVYYDKKRKAHPNIQNKEYILKDTDIDNFIFGYNLTWVLCRIDQENKNSVSVPQWSGFGKMLCEDNTCVTTVGFLPLLPYVATDYDTVWTTMTTCNDIAKKLSMDFTVITFDQAIYFKAKEIQWLKPEECSHFIIRLGGFHILMNFLKVIGQHMEISGLTDVWLECGLYGESTVRAIFEGKKWNKAIRAHKLTYESLMKILINKFEEWLIECKNDEIHTFHLSRLMATEVCRSFDKKEYPSDVMTLIRNNEKLSDVFTNFITSQSSTFIFWFTYINLVETLLEFLYAERSGNWKLHLQSLKKMLPWFFSYDHTNYARWGCVYLCDMLNLEDSAPQVHKEFLEGNFVIKRLKGNFNNISVDQALEHTNKISKEAGGIVGLTKNDARLQEWYLSFNDIGLMVNSFTSSLKVGNGNHNCTQNIETGKKRILLDKQTVLNIQDQLNKFEVFDYDGQNLVCISTKEIFSNDVQTQKLTAKQRGKVAMNTFVQICDTADFYKPLKKLNKSIPIIKKSKKNTFQMHTLQGQQFLQKILAAKEMGRNINYNEIFQHELTPLPMSLAGNGQLNTPSNKSALGKILEAHTFSVKTLPDKKSEKCCYIYDGMSVVQRLGKPGNCKTFDEYASIFTNIIFENNNHCKRIDVVFDHYNNISIKNNTRQKRGSNTTIDILINNANVPLPQQWHLFIHSSRNKHQLTNFLSEKLVETASIKNDVEFVTSGGFTDILEFKVNFKIDHEHLLISDHEEADTRILLHLLSAKLSGYNRCIIDCCDTDVLVLLVHFNKYLPKEVWMKTGKSASTRYIAIHDINLSDNLIRNLPAFHALTGCDSTSQLSGFGKKTCWKTFIEFCECLDDMGVAHFSEEMFKRIHNFVIKLYAKNSEVNCIDVLRGIMAAYTPINKLPPTKDALKHHCLRAYYQTKVWRSALEPRPKLPSFQDYGWKIDEEDVVPVFTTLPPFPDNLNVLVSCGCKKDCRSKKCLCKKKKLGCIGACKCMAQKSCKNTYTSKIHLMTISDSDSDELSDE